MKFKGHSQLWDRADLDPSFLTLKKVHLNLKSKNIYKFTSIFAVFCLIFNRLLKNHFFECAFALPMTILLKGHSMTECISINWPLSKLISHKHYQEFEPSPRQVSTNFAITFPLHPSSYISASVGSWS